MTPRPLIRPSDVITGLLAMLVTTLYGSVAHLGSCPASTGCERPEVNGHTNSRPCRTGPPATMRHTGRESVTRTGDPPSGDPENQNVDNRQLGGPARGLRGPVTSTRPGPAMTWHPPPRRSGTTARPAGSGARLAWCHGRAQRTDHGRDRRPRQRRGRRVGRAGLAGRRPDPIRVHGEAARRSGRRRGRSHRCVRGRGGVAAAVEDTAAPLRAVVNLIGGYAAGGLVHETPVDDFEAMLRLNLRPTYLVTAAALPHLMTAGAIDRLRLVAGGAHAVRRGGRLHHREGGRAGVRQRGGGRVPVRRGAVQHRAPQRHRHPHEPRRPTHCGSLPLGDAGARSPG